MPNSKDIRTATETQDRRVWRLPTGTLGELIEAAERRARLLEPARSELESQARLARPRTCFADHLAGHKDVSIIAEVKRASPSKGTINSRLNAADQARAYEAGGARAISVLTEPKSFGGDNLDLATVAASTSLPVLRKDFHVSPLQLFEARALGASTALLIARALEPPRFQEMVAAAEEIGLEILAEIRSESELDVAVDAGCKVIGINNRNLETLEIEKGTVERLLPHVPSACIAVAESGYSTREGIQAAAEKGADAVLIGSFVSAANDAAHAVRSLTKIERVFRG